MKVRCPRCGKKTVYAESNPNRPFCSERCKQIDLGTWASEGYVIPGEPVDPSSLPTLPPGSRAPASAPGGEEQG